MGRPIAFLNRYNTGSMRDLMAASVSNQDPHAALYSNGSGGFYDYHLTRFLVALPEDEAKARRDLVTRMYHDAARRADVFVFTLGLCESFYDRDGGAYLNVTPDPRTARGHDIEFRFLDYAQNLAYVREIVAGIRSLNPAAKIILTVSPVPLDSTFTGHDIVVANSLAKSTLVAVANAVSGETDDCFYFPSYEIVMTSQPSQAWLWDKKHVAKPLVEHIMKTFTTHHIR